jgi:catechol 2,3-dioxygenase-like lactoylglutathione lyase family enzyme
MRRLICIGVLIFCVAALSTAQPAPSLVEIAHVAFRVNDVEKSRAFYKLLGFEQAFEFSQGDKTSVSYMKVNDRQFIELYQRFKDSDAIGFMHICLESIAIDSLAKEYASRGLDISVPRKSKVGHLLSAIHDPEGRLIEFTEYMPGSLHFEDRGKHLSESRVSEHLWRVVIPADDPKALRAFYTDKLGFLPDKSGDEGFLRVPGTLDEAVQISATRAGAQIALGVHDLQRTERELRARGLKVGVENQTLSLTDPDGNVIAFAVEGASGLDSK